MEIREVREGDEGGIRALFAVCFGRELSRAEWDWKYKDSPWGGSGAVALEGGEIVAHYGGIRMKFYFKGKTFDVYQPCDVMTHPRYRARLFSKRGAMVKAGEHFYEVNPMDFAFGFPSERHAVLGTKQLGYTRHGYVSVLKKRVSASAAYAGNLFRKIEKGWNSVSGKALDSLWEKVRDNQRLSIEKDSRYLFWRYRDHPTRHYEPLIVRGRFSNVPDTLAVISFGESELLIHDLFPCAKKDAGMLLDRIERIAAERGFADVTVWADPQEDLSEVFVGRGYMKEKGIPYIFKIMDGTIRTSFLYDNYRYRMGDYDAV